MLITVTAATVEPVTLAQAKAHLQVIHDADDDKIEAKIREAREYVELHTGRALADASYRWASIGHYTRLSLPLWPVTVTEVSYLDANDVRQVLAPASYTFDADRNWIVPEGVYRSVNVAFDTVAGVVPETLKAAIKLIVADLYENTEAGTERALAENPAVQRLIWLNRLNLGV